MHWVLILWFAGYHGAAATAAVFDDEQACRAAYTEMKLVNSGNEYANMYAICAPTGSPK